MLPEVMGVTWLSKGSPSYTPVCKHGEGEMNVFECPDKEASSCFVSTAVQPSGGSRDARAQIHPPPRGEGKQKNLTCSAV